MDLTQNRPALGLLDSRSKGIGIRKYGIFWLTKMNELLDLKHKNICHRQESDGGSSGLGVSVNRHQIKGTVSKGTSKKPSVKRHQECVRHPATKARVKWHLQIGTVTKGTWKTKGTFQKIV